MRLVIDSLIGVMLLAILLGVVIHHRAGERANQRVIDARLALATLHEQTVYRAALQSAETEGVVAFPEVIDPAWFGKGLPTNPLAAEDRPWIDLAPEGDLQDHPPDPVLSQPDQASFWYNPSRGVFRARVPQQLTERQTLEMYNQINAVALAELPLVTDQSRLPLAMRLPPGENNIVHASPDPALEQQVAEETEPAPEAPPAAAPASLKSLLSR